MGGWLAMWNAPVLPAGAPMQWKSHPGMTSMPGMATTAELDARRTAKGAALDRLFLKLMLRHHADGLPMAADAGTRATLPAVRSLAERMAFQQREETATITALL